MKIIELSEKILQGGNLAIERLIKRKRKEDGELAIFQDGKVVILKAKDIPLPSEQNNNLNS